jgi:hypothetical protein
MQSIQGKISELLRDALGRINGIVLDGGREVHSSVTQLDQIAAIVTPGARIEIRGDLRFSTYQQSILSAVRITNLDSNQTTSLPAHVCLGKPGMLLHATPTTTVSLAPPNAVNGIDGVSDAGSGATILEDALEQRLTEMDTKPLHPGSYLQSLPGQNDGNGTELEKNDAARRIGFAYDRLHRIQAILAYMHIMKHRVPGISQFLDEAKHTYEQALSRFTESDFASAKEFAGASASLSRVVEIVMARTLRSDTSLPSLVRPPPDHLRASPEPGHVEENLAQAESVLSRIHWVLENGTLPSEDRAQVRKIAAWGDAFYKQAQHKYRDTVLEDAAEFAQAALAGAHSAEHVCRKWYVSHPIHS